MIEEVTNGHAIIENLFSGDNHSSLIALFSLSLSSFFFRKKMDKEEKNERKRITLRIFSFFYAF